MKTLLLASAAAVMLAIGAAPAAAESPVSRGYMAAHQEPYVYVAGRAYRDPFAFPRGVAYGTGYRGVGSLTGGPAGGLPSRN